jgi:hypothetical protein
MFTVRTERYLESLLCRFRAVVRTLFIGTGTAGLTAELNPTTIRIGTDALRSEEEMAITIAHELRHARAYLGSGSNEESAAIASEVAMRALIQGLR